LRVFYVGGEGADDASETVAASIWCGIAASDAPETVAASIDWSAGSLPQKAVFCCESASIKGVDAGG
jgi:hypothetical protein